MTWLEEALSDILDQLRALRLARSAEVNAYVQGLGGSEREGYIRRYEAFWFPVTTIFNLLTSMLLAVKELEKLGRQSRESTSTPDEQDVGAMMEAPYRVAAQSRELYGQIYVLLKFLEELGWLNLATVSSLYPELRYVWLLRNKFIVHPPTSAPLMFESVGTQTVTSGDVRELPYAVVGPPGLGLTFYWTFFAEKAGIGPSVMDLEQLQEENKAEFLRLEGWGGVARNELILSRMKAFGIAPVRQERLARELRELFHSRVIPEITKQIEQAVQDRILYRHS